MSGDSKPEVALSDKQVINTSNGSIDEDAETPSLVDWTYEEEVKAKRKYVQQDRSAEMAHWKEMVLTRSCAGWISSSCPS